jgi:hypothetical protein
MAYFEIDGVELDFSRVPISYGLDSPFFVSQASTHAKVTTRLLLGGGYLKASVGESKQQNNYFVIGAPKSAGAVAADVMRAFSDLSEERGGKLFTGRVIRPISAHLDSQRVNHALFYPLLSELAKSFLNQGLGRNLSAFVHVYRAVENVSYSFPLFYCRYSREYSKVYSQLKSFFQGGELDFCSNFYARLLLDDALDGSRITVKFSGPFKKEFADHLHNHINWILERKTGAMAISKVSDGVVDIALKDCFNLIVNIRNSYFHHLSGGSKNSSSKDIKDPDSFFMPINEIAYQVLGYLIGKLIRVQL